MIQSSASRLFISFVLTRDCLSAGCLDLCKVWELASSHSISITIEKVILKWRICWCSQQWACSQFLLLYGRHGEESSNALPLNCPRNCPSFLNTKLHYRVYCSSQVAILSLIPCCSEMLPSQLLPQGSVSFMICSQHVGTSYAKLCPYRCLPATVGTMAVCVRNLMNLHTSSEKFICNTYMLFEKFELPYLWFWAQEIHKSRLFILFLKCSVADFCITHRIIITFNFNKIFLQFCASYAQPSLQHSI
jgi:hypothetical protein